MQYLDPTQDLLHRLWGEAEGLPFSVSFLDTSYTLCSMVWWFRKRCIMLYTNPNPGL